MTTRHDLRKALVKAVIKATEANLPRAELGNALLHVIEDFYNTPIEIIEKKCGVRPDGFVKRLDYDPTVKGPRTR